MDQKVAASVPTKSIQSTEVTPQSHHAYPVVTETDLDWDDFVRDELVEYDDDFSPGAGR